MLDELKDSDILAMPDVVSIVENQGAGVYTKHVTEAFRAGARYGAETSEAIHRDVTLLRGSMLSLMEHVGCERVHEVLFGRECTHACELCKMCDGVEVGRWLDALEECA